MNAHEKTHKELLAKEGNNIDANMINNLNFGVNNSIIMNTNINNNIGVINVPYPTQNLNLFPNNNIQEINYIPKICIFFNRTKFIPFLCIFSHNS